MSANRKQRAKSVACGLVCWLAVCLGLSAGLFAQTNTAEKPPATAQAESVDLNLADLESRLAERYDRLELLAARLAELSRATQPRRARLLRELVAKSRERDIAGHFEIIVRSLRQENLSTASNRQAEIQAELQKLLDLLLQEDRDRQIESQRKRIGKYLAELKKLIRLQRGIKARTDGGDQAEPLTKDQGRLAKLTDQLRDQIETTEGTPKPASDQDNATGDAEGKPDDQAPQQSPNEDSPPKPDKGSPGQSDQQQPSQGSKPESPAESSQQDTPESGQPSANESASPSERATQRLQQARQRMQKALQKLEKAQREDAAQQQKQALRELQQAKAELERILRQLREEELERMLVLLEARFRKMLDAQIEVYEQTQKLEATQAQAPAHEVEIASGRLSRKERQIVHDADRVLILLREDGTSVAFPEAMEQAREDMQAVAGRLAEVKLGMLTQGLEEDIIAALEETLAALQKAMKDLRQQQSQQRPPSGPPGEQPLVDQLAELRMIRALQVRVNRRTERYGKLINGPQALKAELLEALERLSIRQEHIFQATHDLHTGQNQ